MPKARRAGRAGAGKADSKKLASFLVKLSKDPALRGRYRRNPHGTMKAAGLSSAHRAAVKSGNAGRIRKAMGSEGPPGCLFIVV
jgi:hypothetical protein